MSPSVVSSHYNTTVYCGMSPHKQTASLPVKHDGSLISYKVRTFKIYSRYQECIPNHTKRHNLGENNKKKILCLHTTMDIRSFCFTRRSLILWYCGKTILPSDVCSYGHSCPHKKHHNIIKPGDSRATHTLVQIVIHN